jgi:hypothetical protein
MKTIRLTTYWDTDQVITLINIIEELRQTLLDTYRDEIEQYQNQQRFELQKGNDDNLDLFDDNIEF